jgi:MFS family permease
MNNQKRWYVLGLGAVINLIVFAMGTTCMPVLFSEIADELGLNVVQLGAVWGFSSIASIFSIVTAGFLADRFGAKRILFIACMIAGVFGATRGLSNSFGSLIVTSLLFGLAAEAVPVIVIKNAGLWFHDKDLGTAQSIITAMVGVGMMLGAMISATWLSPLLGGWRNVLYFYGALSVIAGFVWLLTVPEPPITQTSSNAAVRSPRQALGHLLRIKSVWLIAIGMMGFAGGNKGLTGYLPLYLRDIGWTAAAADGALAVYNAAGAILAIPLALLSDKLGLRKPVLIPGLVITVISVGLFGAVTGPAVWLLAVVAGAARDMIWALAATMTVETEGIGPAYAGAAVGTVHTFTRIGYTYAPPAGNAFASIQSGLPFVFWAGMSMIAVFAFLFVREKGRKNKILSAPR